MLVCHLADDLVDGILGYILQPDTLEVLKPESDKVLIILYRFFIRFFLKPPQAGFLIGIVREVTYLLNSPLLGL